MADAIAVVILAVQYALVVLGVDLLFGKTSGEVVMGIFVFFTAIALAIWHAKKNKTPREWGILALISISLGILFFGADWVNAYLNGYSTPFRVPGGGGPLGLLLTALVCPCTTMVCIAGSVRALYIDRIQ